MRALFLASLLFATCDDNIDDTKRPSDMSANVSDGGVDLYGVRSVDNAGVMPLFDALDQARILIASCVHQLRAPPAVRVRALRALSTAHQRLVGATTGLVLEAVHPFTDRLREAQAVTAELRDAVAKAERRRAGLERQFATIVDPSLPWGAHGATDW